MVLERLPQGGRVAVLRLRSLGDCVLTTPALDILRRARPDLRVAVVVEDRFRAIFEGNPDLDAILAPEVTAVRDWRPDLCINLHGGSRSALLAALCAARFRAGFEHFRYAPVYNVNVPKAQEILDVKRKVHTAEHLASAIFYLGAPKSEIPRSKLFAEVAVSRGALGARPVAASHYAVIHPTASHPTKTWPAANFAAVAGRLDLEPVFIAGAGEDLTPFERWRTIAGAPLTLVKSLLAGASVFIGNDSGPAHMAAAFGIPVVTIFGASDPVIWGPWRTPSEILTGPSGIASVQVEDVLAALGRLRVHV